jgi:HEPN domain-containing protein
MPSHKGETYPFEWINKAEQDLGRVAKRLVEGDTEDAAFHLQQAIEKFFKGFLLSTAWKLKKIHDLEALLDDAVRVAPKLEAYRALCQQVTGYYLAERYPITGGGSFRAGNSFGIS